VIVEEKLKSDEGTTVKTMYLFKEDVVIGSSYPEYKTDAVSGANKTSREAYAREVAMQARDGSVPIMPVMYEGKYAYSPRYDGGCDVVVTEKNSNFEITGVFKIDVCTSEK
jgi:hypothetical protein